ncbi:MAG: DUF2341 domain-containing protein [Candidatus Omnitrophica bacterium]|nr:DUF2341 domain-containing protein [Candidatus Omnitrophota bacterium]
MKKMRDMRVIARTNEVRTKQSKAESRRDCFSRHGKTMGGIAMTVGALVLALCLSAPILCADPGGAVGPDRRAVFTQPLIWRSDLSGGFTLKGLSLSGAEIARDGSVTTGAAPGTCTLPNTYQTEGPITELSAAWKFTGKVTMEVSVTGDSRDYIKVTNGVPVYYKEPAYGFRIKWRATLGPDSGLSEVKITYSDLSGVRGSFGNELLSGFTARKKVYINGTKAGDLYNYQVPVNVGESAKAAAPCDVKLNGGILADFADVRFTLADGETMVPHYLECINGRAPDRVARFWIKVPEIPAGGVSVYMYYGASGAADLSDGEKVFDFFDDFYGAVPDAKKWKISLEDPAGTATVTGSVLSLNKSKATTTDYKFASGIIEYKARILTAGALGGIARVDTAGNDLTAYSSTIGASEHCIAKGNAIKANDTKPIAPGAYYFYGIYLDDKGDMLFRRYAEDGAGNAQAEAKYSAGTAAAFPIGISPMGQGSAVECDWIRARKSAYPAPYVNAAKTASMPARAVNLPEFYNVITAPDGSLAAAPKTAGGYYLSRYIGTDFDTRIITPEWAAENAVEGSPAVSISTVKDGKFYTGWKSGVARYASKREFEPGRELRFKAAIAAPRGLDSGTALKLFSLTFQPGVIRVLLPKGGESLLPGSKYSIFYEAAGYDASYPMDIAYSIDRMKTFLPIAIKVSNTGDYSWDVPDKLMEKVIIKVSDYYDKSIYGISESYFSIGAAAQVEEGADEAAGAGEEAVEAQPAEEAAQPAEKSLEGMYDLLIKIGDSAGEGGYKDGDIVMVKPAGYVWGVEEKGKFYIVRARLTPQRAAELMKPREKITSIDRRGRRTVQMTGKRKYNFSIKDRITLQERAAASRGKLSVKPVEIEDIATLAKERK